jgi:hypothetical protein
MKARDFSLEALDFSLEAFDFSLEGRGIRGKWEMGIWLGSGQKSERRSMPSGDWIPARERDLVDLAEEGKTGLLRLTPMRSPRPVIYLPYDNNTKDH